MNPFLAGLLIFTMRVIDTSLDTVRTLYIMRGRKLLAGSLGVVEAAVFIIAVSTALQGPLSFWTVVGYAAGFGAGTIVGMYAEEYLGVGYVTFRVYSPANGPAVVQALRAAGYSFTEFAAQGQRGSVTMVSTAIARKDALAVQAIVEQADPQAFVTVTDVRPWRPSSLQR